MHAKLVRSSLSTLALLALTATACDNQATDLPADVATTSGELVGGHVATEAEFPSAVFIFNCTAAKVGPRHFLTAAHCINDANRQVPPGFSGIQMTPANDASNPRILNVVSAHILPEWTAGEPSCEGFLCGFGFVPDVALIIVAEDTPDVPAARIDDTPVVPGDAVVMTGYGCENGFDQPSPPARFKVHQTVAVDPLIYSPGEQEVAEAYVVTPGLDGNPSSASLCAGDSGGPLYRAGTNLVVGVNALAAWTSPQGITFANWHTRLDIASRANVFGFLKDLGANGDGPVSNRPCSYLCTSPTPMPNQTFQSGSMGSGTRCFESTRNLTSGVCGGFASPRRFSVNNVQVTCNGPNFALPPKRNGGYCFEATAGPESWAWFSAW